jgi:hypothetical protein
VEQAARDVDPVEDAGAFVPHRALPKGITGVDDRIRVKATYSPAPVVT